MIDRRECVEPMPIVGPADAAFPVSIDFWDSFASSVPSSLTFLVMLVTLGDLLVNVLAMLVTLNFRIMDDAEERTACSLLARAVMPGKGRTSRVQTSDTRASSRARSPGEGARTGTRPVVASNDCERLIEVDGVLIVGSFSMVVFFKMICDNGDFGPTVVAR